MGRGQVGAGRWGAGPSVHCDVTPGAPRGPFHHPAQAWPAASADPQGPCRYWGWVLCPAGWGSCRETFRFPIRSGFQVGEAAGPVLLLLPHYARAREAAQGLSHPAFVVSAWTGAPSQGHALQVPCPELSCPHWLPADPCFSLWASGADTALCLPGSLGSPSPSQPGDGCLLPMLCCRQHVNAMF